MVHPVSIRVPRVLTYLGNPKGGYYVFVYRAVTFCGAQFQNASTNV